MGAQSDDDLPTQKLARAGVFGKVAGQILFNELKLKAKRPFMAEENIAQAKYDNDQENAKILFNALSHLRGTATKLGQLFAMEMDLLPEVYNDELAKSFYKVTPINRTLVRKIIINELKSPPEEIFAEFENISFASASFGQVHRAILKDNSIIAFKIQYPSIEEATINDLEILRSFASAIPKYKIFLAGTKEIERGILEETNYLNEAQNTIYFYENCHLDNIKIPKIYSQFTTKKVIASEFIDGLHLDDFLKQNPSQANKNEIAQILYDFFVHSVRNLHCLHADPNPGNYIFCENGKVAIVDFGCVKKFDPRFCEILPILFNAHLTQDKEKIIEAYYNLGIAPDKINDQFYEDFIKPFGQWSVAPLKDEEFDFAKFKHTLNGNHFMRQLANLEIFAKLADDFVFFNRTIYGLCKIFEKMNAKIKIKSRWQ
jgi:predicted unusual protein kinase regulating ubiquinone biosynthesis (AarF/ABC1/UbiB family)